jgi:hypothetical protein
MKVCSSVRLLLVNPCLLVAKSAFSLPGYCYSHIYTSYILCYKVAGSSPDEVDFF